jgi:hypothetical protein
MRLKRTQHLLPLAVLLAAVLAVSSCASFQRARNQSMIQKVADSINAGQADMLAGLSGSPFLLDGEIIPLAADVSAFWAGIIKAGFRVEAAELVSSAPVGTDAYQQFASTMEVKSFFSRYVGNDSRILELGTSSGKHIRLLIRDETLSWSIIGFKGPF